MGNLVQAITSQAATQLPNEVLLTILGLLDHDTFIVGMQVCKEWRFVIKGDDILWSHHVQKRFPLQFSSIKCGKKGLFVIAALRDM